MTEVASRVVAASGAFKPVADFYFRSRYADRRFAEGIADFTFGNPHEMPLAGLVTSLRERAVPGDQNWFAYKTSEEEPAAFVAERLSAELGLAFETEDIALTPGAFVALSVAMRLVLEPGDEAIFSEPAWFCYEPMLELAGAVAKKVILTAGSFDLDLAAIEAAITPKTRMVIVNTPHNPTGRIYDADSLGALAGLLERASARNNRRIFLVSDEPYRRLRFEGRDFVSPAAIYPWTMISYSYGKVLLAPGQRLGYLAVSPLMPRADREALRDACFPTQMALGWTFPNALMQYAIPDLEGLSIDIAALTRRRDTLMATLSEAGYEVLAPEGTFYLFSRWPSGGANDPWNALADRDVFVMPGSILNAPDYFRISLTASDAMVEKSLPAFREVAQSG
ncbi:MAG: aminotransferase class I/II-fold pyridoxal phosphate-dependent enzyme [Bauldia sp.]|uniref:aminotransferase class I/II-fold pyridoxal phosphate-dependent enzyme n=1 Tax=Bauldia sp. TaxID=2575872 RepID=UPI001E104F43|nr:aminotransferase class I/II-fold pyridoxal phosphate-dependent enzyme [Bauldia sp.]MCB1496708.1 aminotransferase class I/II-fold pyridoxal phosphate-dependent enzyme [Bauldia sp.]